MNANTPALRIYVFKQFLTDHVEDLNEKEGGYLYAVKALRHKALGFHVLLDSGASYWNLPIHALTTTWQDDEGPLSLEQAQLWSNIGEKLQVTEFDFLRRMRCSVFLADRAEKPGTYRFTIDYLDHGTLADTPSEHKCAHIIELGSGHLVAYPNNRVIFSDASLTDGSAKTKGYKINSVEWLVDDSGLKVAQDGSFLY